MGVFVVQLLCCTHLIRVCAQTSYIQCQVQAEIQMTMK